MASVYFENGVYETLGLELQKKLLFLTVGVEVNRKWFAEQNKNDISGFFNTNTPAEFTMVALNVPVVVICQQTDALMQETFTGANGNITIQVSSNGLVVAQKIVTIYEMINKLQIHLQNVAIVDAYVEFGDYVFDFKHDDIGITPQARLFQNCILTSTGVRVAVCVYENSVLLYDTTTKKWSANNDNTAALLKIYTLYITNIQQHAEKTEQALYNHAWQCCLCVCDNIFKYNYDNPEYYTYLSTFVTHYFALLLDQLKQLKKLNSIGSNHGYVFYYKTLMTTDFLSKRVADFISKDGAIKSETVYYNVIYPHTTMSLINKLVTIFGESLDTSVCYNALVQRANDLATSTDTFSVNPSTIQNASHLAITSLSDNDVTISNITDFQRSINRIFSKTTLNLQLITAIRKYIMIMKGNTTNNIVTRALFNIRPSMPNELMNLLNLCEQEIFGSL